ncbi:hypothetical protein ACOMHN_030885 [Nucella lapillus]
MMRILALTKRHKESPRWQPKQKRMDNTTWGSEPAVPSDPVQRACDAATLLSGSSSSVPEQMGVSFSPAVTSTPRRKEGERREAAPISEGRMVPDRGGAKEEEDLYTGMSSLQQSLMEMLQDNTNLQDTVIQLTQSNNFMQENINHLKEELRNHKMNSPINLRPQTIRPISRPTSRADECHTVEIIQKQPAPQKDREDVVEIIEKQPAPQKDREDVVEIIEKQPAPQKDREDVVEIIQKQPAPQKDREDVVEIIQKQPTPQKDRENVSANRRVDPQEQQTLPKKRENSPAKSRKQDPPVREMYTQRHERHIDYPGPCRKCFGTGRSSKMKLDKLDGRGCTEIRTSATSIRKGSRTLVDEDVGTSNRKGSRTLVDEDVGTSNRKGSRTLIDEGVGSSEALLVSRRPRKHRRDVFDRATGSDEMLVTSRGHRPGNGEFIPLEGKRAVVNGAAGHWTRPSGSVGGVVDNCGRNDDHSVRRCGKHSAERPYSPTPPRQDNSFERLANAASILEEKLRQEVSVEDDLYLEVQQLSPAERVDSQGFELCSLCQHSHVTCGCGQGSENNNSDCRPGSPAQMNHSSRRPVMSGSTCIHNTTTREWHGGNRQERAEEQRYRQPQPRCPTPSPYSRDHTPSTSRDEPQTLNADQQRDPTGVYVQQKYSWGQEFDNREDAPQRLAYAGQHKSSTARSETYYEEDGERLPSAQCEKRKGTVKAKLMYDQDITIYPGRYTDGMREQCKSQEGRLASGVPRFTTEEKVCTTTKGNNTERNEGVSYTYRHDCRGEFNDSLKSQSSYEEEVIKPPQSQEIRSSMEYSKIKLRNPPPTMYCSSGKKMMPETQELRSSSSGSKELPSYVDHGYNVRRRNSFAREKRRANDPRQLLSYEQLPYLSRPAEYSSPCSVLHGSTAARGTRSNTPSPGSHRPGDRGPWGSHANTKDTISPNRLPDQISRALEDSISSQNTDGTADSRDQGSIQSFSRVMERTVGPKKERWKYERQKIHVKTFPRFDATPVKLSNVPQTPVQKQKPTAPKEKRAGNELSDGEDDPQRNASRSSNISTPRLLDENKYFSNEASWDRYTSFGKRLPPPLSDEEMDAGRYRSLPDREDSISVGSTSEQQSQRKKSKKKEKPPFKYPRKHDCGCHKDSFAHPGKSPQAQCVGKSSGQQECATHFSRWTSNPSVSGSQRSGHRHSSASPRAERGRPMSSQDERRSRSASSKRSRQKDDIDVQLSRCQQALTLARSLPVETIVSEDPYFADEDSLKDSETEQRASYPLSQRQDNWDEYSSQSQRQDNWDKYSLQSFDKRGEVIQKPVARDFTFTSQTYEQDTRFTRSNNQTNQFSQQFDIPQNDGHQLEITIGIKSPSSFKSGGAHPGKSPQSPQGSSEPSPWTSPETAMAVGGPQCSSAGTVQPGNTALKPRSPAKAENTELTDCEAAHGPVTSQWFSQENSTFQSTMVQNMEMMQQAQNVQHVAQNSPRQRGESAQSEKQKEENIFIGIMIKTNDPHPKGEQFSQQDDLSNTSRDNRPRVPEQNGRDRRNVDFQDTYDYERREQSARQVEHNVEKIYTENIQAIRGANQPITEYNIEREMFGSHLWAQIIFLLLEKHHYRLEATETGG